MTFMWLPSHVGLAGNVSVEAAAKAALNIHDIISLPFSVNIIDHVADNVGKNFYIHICRTNYFIAEVELYTVKHSVYHLQISFNCVTIPSQKGTAAVSTVYYQCSCCYSLSPWGRLIDRNHTDQPWRNCYVQLWTVVQSAENVILLLRVKVPTYYKQVSRTSYVNS